MDAHCKHEGVVRNDLAIVKDHVLVRSVDISHTCVNNLNAGFKHKLLKLFEGIAGRVRLQVAFLVWNVVVRESTW